MLFELEMGNVNHLVSSQRNLYPYTPSPSMSGSFTSETEMSNPNLEAAQVLRLDPSQPENCATVAATALSDFLVFMDL
jgi:hypothetical protein